MTRSYLIDELDKTLALVGFIFSLILIIWLKIVIGRPIYIMAGIFCFIVFTGYLRIRKLFYPSLINSLEEIQCSTRFYIALNILFFLLLSYSIITIYLRPDPYIRPLGYFISTALMAVVVSNEILFMSPKKSHIYFTLCKIIIIGLSLAYSQIVIFPNVVGVDPWWHQSFTLKILDNGHIPEGLVYSKLPIMHLIIGITSLVIDLGYKMATMLSINFLQIVSDALFVFLLGTFLINTKVGLLAALLLEVASLHIRFGYVTRPNTLAATLILPIIFILLKVRKDKPFIGTPVVIFLMGTLVLTHTLTSMFLAILLFVFWVSSLAYTRLSHQENNHSVTWTMCILFSTTMLAYWSYISGHIITLSNFIKLGFQNLLLEKNLSYLSTIPLWEQLFNKLGLFLFFSLSFIGCLYMMSKQFRNSNRFITTIGGIMILCLAFFTIIAGKNVLGDRWYYFSQILMAIPLSLSLFLLNGIFKHQRIKGLLMSILVLTLSFLSIMSSDTNIDNRLFSPNIGVRSAFTTSELDGIDTLSRIWNGKMGIDKYIIYPYDLRFNREIVSLDDSLYTGDFTELQGVMILVREEIVKHSFQLGMGYFKLEYDLHMTLSNQNFSQIYDSGSASGYLKPKS